MLAGRTHAVADSTASVGRAAGNCRGTRRRASVAVTVVDAVAPRRARAEASAAATVRRAALYARGAIALAHAGTELAALPERALADAAATAAAVVRAAHAADEARGLTHADSACAGLVRGTCPGAHAAASIGIAAHRVRRTHRRAATNATDAREHRRARTRAGSAAAVGITALRIGTALRIAAAHAFDADFRFHAGRIAAARIDAATVAADLTRIAVHVRAAVLHALTDHAALTRRAVHVLAGVRREADLMADRSGVALGGARHVVLTVARHWIAMLTGLAVQSVARLIETARDARTIDARLSVDAGDAGARIGDLRAHREATSAGRAAVAAFAVARVGLAVSLQTDFATAALLVARAGAEARDVDDVEMRIHRIGERGVTSIAPLRTIAAGREGDRECGETRREEAGSKAHERQTSTPPQNTHGPVMRISARDELPQPRGYGFSHSSTVSAKITWSSHSPAIFTKRFANPSSRKPIFRTSPRLGALRGMIPACTR